MIAFRPRQLRHTTCLTLFASMVALLPGVANADVIGSSSACIGCQPVVAAAEWTPVESPASVGPPLLLRLLRLTI